MAQHRAPNRTETVRGRPSRDDSVTTRAVAGDLAPSTATPLCLACQTPLPAVTGRQTYCDQACRQAAYRRRHPPAERTTAQALPKAASRRANTVYACPDCETRYLGQQRCDDCNTFATRLGQGGTCPDCGEIVTVEELLAAT